MGSQLVVLFWLILSILFVVSNCGLVPAIYVFGDSLVDVGNNNHLKLSIAKANFPHNGLDFPTKRPTGRFSNGKNVADYVAEKAGLATSPPYLSLISKFRKITNTTSFKTGVSFASGGAGIFNQTNTLFKQSLAMEQQIELYSSVYKYVVGELGSGAAAEAHFSKSLFTVVIGSNDIFGYHQSSDLRNKYSPHQYMALMASTLESQLKRLYKYGARKYVVAGVGLVGCAPSQRKRSKTGECDEEVNNWVAEYNINLKSMLQRMKMELSDLAFSYFDVYAVFSNFITTPSSYGFTEIRSACCGLGNLNADAPCLPIAALCSNRTNHLFWDLYHPTQEANRMFANFLFDGPFTFPLNVNQLISL